MIELQGMTELLTALRSRAVAIEVAGREATHEAAEVVATAIQHNLQLKSHPPHTPTPSAPGEPPAKISGNLMESVHVEGPATVGAKSFARVGPTAIYGRIQELGGIAGRGAHLPARPYVAPALRDSKSAIGFIYLEAFGAALRG